MSNASRRGIKDHMMLWALETARMRLTRMGFSKLDADRISVAVAMMWADDRCTPLDALEAADRIFPLTQTGGDDEAEKGKTQDVSAVGSQEA